MRFLPLVASFAFIGTTAHAQSPHTHAAHGQHDAHHAAVDARGARVMGFDQARTAHHFLLYGDGGAIDVAVKDAANHADRDAIRSHLPHIASRFTDGDFALPMLVHDTSVPGAADLARLKARVRYTYVATAGGGRVDIVTTDAEALAAVHRFLRFQIADHRTGDPGTVGTRP
jgi:hypothetical protein